MLKKIFFPAILCLLFLSYSCRHDTDLSSIRPISFSSDIQVIIIGNCTQSGCHNENEGEVFPLMTYNDVMAKGRVKAGDAHNSKIYNSISNHGSENKMPPPPLSMLSTDQIKLIYIWIEQGALNN